LIEERTDPDGGNVGSVLNDLFEMLDTPPEERQQGDDPEFDKFPYVNGKLFTGHLRRAVFDAEMRDDLLAAAKFDWGKVSPAIFGSLFQSVMDRVERRKKGAHYTTEPNIMKLIGPLFLDELRAEFDRLKARRDGGKRAALLAFQEKLGGLHFFDPACGCGNFLVITYRELRRLEQEVLELVFDASSPMMFEVESLSILRLDHFHGIELEEFPAHIAEVAMWMTEHLANIELGRTFGKVFADIPLTDSAHIIHADALEIDWDEVLPHKQCFAVMGNPPFVGAKLQSDEQRQQVRALAAISQSGGTLDFVAAWFIKAGAYVAKGPTRIAFVATNSITQGEQVAQLWPILFDRFGLEISFAHRTFAWGSDARGKAHVHVVIIGLTHRKYETKEKRLFSYSQVNAEPDETNHSALTAYLFDAREVANPHAVVRDESRPINFATKLSIGSKPVDGGYLIFDAAEREALLFSHPDANGFLKPFIGAQDFVRGTCRWILALQETDPTEIAKVSPVLERLKKVRAFREGLLPAKRLDADAIPKARGLTSSSMAATPAAFHITQIPKTPFLLFPRHTSERRKYLSIGWEKPPTIPSDATIILVDATKYDFAPRTRLPSAAPICARRGCSRTRVRACGC
jgi:hypothetical protein